MRGKILIVIASFFLIILYLFIFFTPAYAQSCTCRSNCLPNEQLIDLCANQYANKYCCVVATNTPYPTRTPAPTATRPPVASPTTPPGKPCTTTDQCMTWYCTGIPNCSAICRNGVCYTTNITPNPTTTGYITQCNTFGNWQCTSGVGACAACASTDYICASRFCIDPPTSNQYQITCGCPTDEGGGGGSNPTNTPAPNNTPTNIPTNTPTPTPILSFAKIKNASFYSNRSLNNFIPASPTAYDADDDGSANFILSSPGSDPGLVSAASINLGQGQPSIKGWKTTSSSNTSLFTPSAFSQYIKSRASYKNITSLSDITSQNYNNQVLFYNDNLDLTNPTIFNNRNLVLVVNGNVNISYTGAFSPLNSSLAILSTNTLTFSSSTTQVNGIFIAQSIDTGSTTNQGLKIIGNLIALDSFTNNRKWSITSRPSVFIIFDKDQYLNLLPMLSTVNYQWKENN